MSYAAQHASALAKVQVKGVHMPLTRSEPGAQDPSTGLYGEPTETVVDGYAFRDEGGEPEAYAARGLIASETPRLFYVTTTYGDIPPKLSTGTFGGVEYTVRDVDPFAPDGLPIFSYLLVQR